MTQQATRPKPHFSLVSKILPDDCERARSYFLSRLMFETDIADLMFDLRKGNEDLVVIDTRSERSYAQCHIPGAINVGKFNEESVGRFSKEKVYVVYCWGPGCNGATNAAMKLSALGFHAKELIGGLEYWRKESGAVEGTLGSDAPMYWNPEEE
ncbi:MAG: rhodanese [Acidobacteria bacterium]|nr:MAG: rhodanese [Acidobacteriota bacterium]